MKLSSLSPEQKTRLLAELDIKYCPHKAIVDAEAFERLHHYTYYASEKAGNHRVYRTIWEKRKTKHIPLSQDVLQTDKMIDHINRNGLDNRKENLRPCTYSENNINRRKRSNASSQYIGVSWHNSNKKWIATITLNTKRIHLGYYNTEVEAAKAYNAKAAELHGSLANLNQLCDAVLVATGKAEL